MQTMHCMVILNAPGIFSMFWGIIKQIIGPHTAKRIQVYINKKKGLLRLRELIDDSEIPVLSYALTDSLIFSRNCWLWFLASFPQAQMTSKGPGVKSFAILVIRSSSKVSVVGAVGLEACLLVDSRVLIVLISLVQIM